MIKSSQELSGLFDIERPHEQVDRQGRAGEARDEKQEQREPTAGGLDGGTRRQWRVNLGIGACCL